MNEAVDIKNQIITQFKAINGSGNFNNTMNANYVSEKWVPLEEAPGFPFICLSMVEFNGQTDWDQGSYTRTAVYEFLGYVKTSDSEHDDLTNKALKLQQDMEKAVMSDPSLNEKGYNVQITSQVGSIDPFGIVNMRINVDFNNTY
jgi:hypothetical protein